MEVEEFPECVNCRYYHNWLIDFPCRACKVAFSENKTNYFEKREDMEEVKIEGGIT